VRYWLVLALASMAATAAPAVAADAPKPVALDAATVRRLAIETAPVRAATQSNAVAGFARVLDPIPLAQLDSDIATARAAAAASTAEAERSHALFAADATVSRKAVEAAAMQARTDGAHLALLRRRVGLEWGPAIARLNDAQRSALVAALASGRAALLRIDSAGGIGQAGLRSVELDLGEQGKVIAAILGPARAADSQLQSPGLIARVSGPKATILSSGLSVPAQLSGTVRSGAAIPPGAVLRVDGAAWVYVQTAPGRFVRKPLGGVAPNAGELFAASGVQAGQRIVTRGAAALYAAERGGGPAREADD
jgi:hypothetical protein